MTQNMLPAIVLCAAGTLSLAVVFVLFIRRLVRRSASATETEERALNVLIEDDGVWRLPTRGAEARLYRRVAQLLDAARDERKAAESERDEARRERDVARRERDILRRERDMARSTRDTLRVEKHALIAQIAAAEAEREAARAENEAAQVEYRVVMAKLEIANKLVRQWSHEGMRLVSEVESRGPCPNGGFVHG